LIRVELLPEEAQGYQVAGNAMDSDVPGVIFLVLCAGGMDEASANYLSSRLASAALVARRKIRDATRFEIVVVAPTEGANQ
jgi:hypothetical protein